MAVTQESGGFFWCPDGALGGRWAGENGGLCGVVDETALADGVAERAGECGEAAVEGDSAAAGVELGAGEAGDVAVGEVVESECAECGDEVVGDVVAVADQGGRFEGEGLASSQVVR
ncbi:hypothetical protein [Streptomyces yatensis]|uniref:hypothetical protein n=1 Tax=Streptomyces yatensis TaxID=155177 RepID=UPI001FEBB967|nr:hypothetical protein [Streptomyces yatensis]